MTTPTRTIRGWSSTRPLLFVTLFLALSAGCSDEPNSPAVDDSTTPNLTDAGGSEPSFDGYVVSATQTLSFAVVGDEAVLIDESRHTSPFSLPQVGADQWSGVYFEHDDYECARDGKQSFLLLNPPNASWDEPLDLFVYLHGGGIGAFDDSGDYSPDFLSQRDGNSMVDQEDVETLVNRWYGGVSSDPWPPQTGLASLVVAAADRRILLVSKCDHDTYAGEGTPDPNNSWNRDNNVDGLWATMAAIETVWEIGAADDDSQLILAGASAGAVGVMNVSRSLPPLGYRVDGIIADGAVMSDAFDEVYANAPEGCDFRSQVADPANWRPRLGRLARSDEQPHLNLDELPPIYLTWTPADSTFCTEANTEAIFRPMHDAVLGRDDGSEAHRVCLDTERGCNAHALIRWAPPGATNVEGECEGDCPGVIESMWEWMNAR